ncbi:MAG: YeeE/YedE family protein [Luminiphilus sp.]|jgi:uncharacterized protein|nr:YeeE/YedE family protein [Luminiphilus sp.]
MKSVSALIAGVLFGLGLTLSGMSDPANVRGFLDVMGNWRPDLAFVMGGAVMITFIATPWVLKRPLPLFHSSFAVPTNVILDKRLITGAALFGIGWGLSGYCPGPALVSLTYGYDTTVVFCIAMIAGMALERLVSR